MRTLRKEILMTTPENIEFRPSMNSILVKFIVMKAALFIFLWWLTKKSQKSK